MGSRPGWELSSPRGSFPGWELSGVGIIWVGIVRVGIVRGVLVQGGVVWGVIVQGVLVQGRGELSGHHFYILLSTLSGGLCEGRVFTNRGRVCANSTWASMSGDEFVKGEFPTGRVD